MLALSFALLTLGFGGRAQAQSSSLHEELPRYFTQERNGAMALIGMGVASLAGGATAVAFDDKLARSLSAPLFVFAGLQTVVGSIVLAGVGERRARLERMLREDPGALVAEELPRMGRVRRDFLTILAIETVLIAGGVASAAAGFATDSPVAQGIGLGFAGEALFTMAWDLTAYARAMRYREALGAFRMGLTASTLGFGIGVAGEF